MNPRTVAQLGVAFLGVTALGLGVAVVVLESGQGSGSGAPDAGGCDITAAPTPLSPLTQDAVLLLWGEKGALLTLDGKTAVSLPDDPQSFPVGEHVIHADCKGQGADLRITLEPYSPAAVWATCPPSFVAFGTECDGCPPLADARKLAAKAGKDSGLLTVSAAQEKLTLLAQSRARHVLTDRWNLLTERYARLLQAVGREAPGPASSAQQRFEQLSDGFKKANQDNEPATQDQMIRTAEETLKVFVHAARLARPHDCDFQKRLTDSL
jgi:hypothetical protein